MFVRFSHKYQFVFLLSDTIFFSIFLLTNLFSNWTCISFIPHLYAACLFILSILLVYSSFLRILFIHPFYTPCLSTLSMHLVYPPFSASFLSILSMHRVYPSSPCILSIHPFYASSISILSMHRVYSSFLLFSSYSLSYSFIFHHVFWSFYLFTLTAPMDLQLPWPTIPCGSPLPLSNLHSSTALFVISYILYKANAHGHSLYLFLFRILHICFVPYSTVILNWDLIFGTSPFPWQHLLSSSL